jgi:hypothetical protein
LPARIGRSGRAALDHLLGSGLFSRFPGFGKAHDDQRALEEDQQRIASINCETTSGGVITAASAVIPTTT